MNSKMNIKNTVTFKIDGVEFTGVIESIQGDEVDVINIMPAIDGDNAATLPLRLITVSA